MSAAQFDELKKLMLEEQLRLDAERHAKDAEKFKELRDEILRTLPLLAGRPVAMPLMLVVPNNTPTENRRVPQMGGAKPKSRMSPVTPTPLHLQKKVGLSSLFLRAPI